MKVERSLTEKFKFLSRKLFDLCSQLTAYYRLFLKSLGCQNISHKLKIETPNYLQESFF